MRSPLLSLTFLIALALLVPASPGPTRAQPSTDLIVFIADEDAKWDNDPNWDIFSIQLDGSDLRQLTGTATSEDYPALSPDGTRIAFLSDQAGNADIYVMDVDGSNVRSLTDSPADEGPPVWSPDGMHIAFTSFDGQRPALYIVDAVGGRPRRVAYDSFWEYAWSPDGTQIAFRTQDEILAVNADGSGLYILSNYAMGQAAQNPRQVTWSPDSQTVLFIAWYDERWEIYAAKAGGAGYAAYLTFGDGHKGNPVWSPDGSQIAFDVSHDNAQEIHVMNADGTDLRRLTDEGTWDFKPVWSHDSSQIAFFSHQSHGDRDIDLYVMDADGTGVRRLTFLHSAWPHTGIWPA